MHLDEHLLCAHNLDDLTNIGTRLLKQAELFSEEAHPRVVVIALCFETAENSLTLEDLELHRLDLVVVVVIERHLEGCGVVSLSNEALVIDVRCRVGLATAECQCAHPDAGCNFNFSSKKEELEKEFKCKYCQLRRRLLDGMMETNRCRGTLCRRRRNSAKAA